jgi:hypothetical protein
MGKMRDSGCAITFTANKAAITNGAATVLTVQCDKDSGLWRFPLGNTNAAQAAPGKFAHNEYEQNSIQDTITYLHACYFSPVQDTWLKYIKHGHFVTWPPLTVDTVR